MIALYYMILSHLLYDFHWQGEFIANNKGKRIFLLFIHALTWAMIVGVPLVILGKYWWILFLFITHFITDYWKSHQPRIESNFYLIYIDQSIHFLTIFIVWFIIKL